ncbi:TRAP transporter large permease [Acuticoccus sediminis]|uniref:TRAP transporter large permease n=1 Tax=Acuticoccus sediminis TaxID=2184697 RepID=UPI00299D9A0B|nr:TRAP transporter large permease subunit [Acuticoccus sediminis]
MMGSHVGEVLAILLFAATIGGVMIGFPVAFTLAGMSLIFAVIGHLFGTFDFTLFFGLPSRYYGTMVNEVLVAVPLFVFMGVMLERSKIATALLETMGQLFGPLRGGLGISVVVVGALLAASTGIVGATVVTMGLLSLPAMLRAGYDPRLATGVVCASGTLGQIVPPSVVLIFLGDILASANTMAQLAKGNFSPDPVSVGDLFAGAMIPGMMLVCIYIGYVIFQAIVNPKSCPPLVMTAEERRTLPLRVLSALIPPLLLIIAVLGSILSGIATPTESASIGALGAMLLAATKRQLTWVNLRDVMRSTMMISSLVFVIVLGASVFSLVFRGLGGELLVDDVLSAMPGGAGGAVLAVMALMFVLGFFLDTFEIILIVVPITAPVLLGLDVDPIWLGVMIGVNLQTSFLTPPVGFALFYLRGVAPPQVTTGHIYRGIVPFVGLQMLAMVFIWTVPQSATWLPEVIFGEGRNVVRDAPVTPDDGGLDSDPTLESPAAGSGSGGGSVLDDLLGGQDLMLPDEEEGGSGGGSGAPSGERRQKQSSGSVLDDLLKNEELMVPD